MSGNRILLSLQAFADLPDEPGTGADDAWHETGFQLGPASVRQSDVAVVLGEREARDDGWLQGAPDIATKARQVRIYRADGTHTLLRESESLSGEDVVPGFVLPLSELFR